MYSIVFICSANICRSPMAHAICAAEAARRGLPLAVTSAGVWDFSGTLPAEMAHLLCVLNKTPMTRFGARHIAQVDLLSAKRVFVMQRSHISSLVAEAGVPLEHISLIGEFDPHQRGAEIEDPIGQDMPAFKYCYERLRDCIIHYLDTTDDFNGD